MATTFTTEELQYIMEVYEIDVLESFECIGGGTDELVLWSDDSITIRHIPATE